MLKIVCVLHIVVLKMMRFILLLAPHLQKNEMHFRIKSQEEWLVIDVKLTLWQRSIFLLSVKMAYMAFVCLF